CRRRRDFPLAGNDGVSTAAIHRVLGGANGGLPDRCGNTPSKAHRTRGLLALSGVVSILFGVRLMFLQPVVGALAVVWLIGGFAILFGILLIALGFRLKGLANRIAPSGAPVGAHR